MVDKEEEMNNQSIIPENKLQIGFTGLEIKKSSTNESDQGTNHN